MSILAKTNVPEITIGETGINVPTTEEVLTGVLADYNTAFGGNLNIESVSTPQYTLSTEQTEAITLQNAAMARTLSMFDPAKAEGRAQDALGRIYFLTRKKGTSTVVSAVCTGAPGYSLPKGSKAKDDNGYTYSSLSEATFSAVGQAIVQFANDTPGAIECSIGSLKHIEIAVYGWDAITNLTAGVTGEDVESRAEFESRRYASVAQNGQSSRSSIYGAVRSLDGVRNVLVEQNDTDQSKTVGETSVSLLPHSIYVAVVGGDDDAIAHAIFNKKPPGCNMNGDVSVTVADDIQGAYSPEYVIKFARPTFIPILFNVQISKNSLMPETIVQLIQQAIIAEFNAEIDNDKIGIGATIYSSRFFGAVTAANEYVDVIDITIGIGTANKTTITMGIDQMPTIDASNIVVTIQEAK